MVPDDRVTRYESAPATGSHDTTALGSNRLVMVVAHVSEAGAGTVAALSDTGAATVEACHSDAAGAVGVTDANTTTAAIAALRSDAERDFTRAPAFRSR